MGNMPAILVGEHNMDDFSGDYTSTNDVISDSFSTMDDFETSVEVNTITIADPADTPDFSRCGCCMHKS